MINKGIFKNPPRTDPVENTAIDFLTGKPFSPGSPFGPGAP